MASSGSEPMDCGVEVVVGPGSLTRVALWHLLLLSLSLSLCLCSRCLVVFGPPPMVHAAAAVAAAPPCAAINNRIWRKEALDFKTSKIGPVNCHLSLKRPILTMWTPIIARPVTSTTNYGFKSLISEPHLDSTISDFTKLHPLFFCQENRQEILFPSLA